MRHNSIPFFVSGTSVILFLIVLACLLSAQERTISEKNYKIFSVKQDKIVGIESVVDDFKDHDVILFGEEHNDAVAHYLEYLLLERSYDRYGNLLALSLEMFDRDVQIVLDEYLSSKITEKYFEKDARVWNNYQDYRPLVEFAREKRMDVIAANAPFRYANLAVRNGQEALKSLPVAARAFIAPLPYDTATGAHYEKLMKVMQTMPGTIEKDTAGTGDPEMPAMPPQVMQSSSINQGQSLWNATMAFSICEYLAKHKHKNRKVIHMNGRFHSDEYFGVPQHLGKCAPQAHYLVISAFPDSAFEKVDFKQYKKLGDYIIVTEPAP